MKKFFFLFCFFFFLLSSHFVQAQITGSDTVCPAYIYKYAVNIPGAVSFTWYLPTGWYFIKGQGTDSVEVNCNEDTGYICVAGHDGTGKTVDSVCKSVTWGGGGPPWHVEGDEIQYCPAPIYILSVVFSGASCGNYGCGNGTPNPNVVYAAFDAPWPTGNYMGIVNGSNTFSTLQLFLTVYVYEVDTTFGLSNMILVEGGLGCPPNNTFEIQGPVDRNIPLAQYPDPACYGDTFVVYSQFLGWCDNCSYYWSFQYQMVSENADSIVLILNDSLVSNFVSWTGTDDIGCDWYGEVQIFEWDCRKPTAAFSSDSVNHLCVNDCIFFKDQSGGDGQATWKWSFPGGTPASSTAEQPYICYTDTGKYPVSLTVVNNYGADSTTINNYVNVVPLPVVNITPDTSICMGSEIQLSASGGISYFWVSTAYLKDRTISNPVATPSVTTTYSVLVTDSNNCKVYSHVIVKVNPYPVVLTSPDTSLCPGSAVQLSASGGVQYAWIPAAGLSDTTVSNPFANPAVTTTYSVNVTDSNGCGGTGLITLIINPSPKAPVITQHHDTLYSTTDSSYVSYQWYADSLLIAGATDTSYVAGHDGNYNIEITDLNGCKISAGIIVLLLNINSTDRDNMISIFPNPAYDKLIVNSDKLMRDQNAVITILNILGQETLSYSLSFGEGRGEAIYIGNLPAGMYFLQMKGESGSVVKKFVKE